MTELNALLQIKPDIRVVYEQIKPGSRVLDLGCGDGALLKLLQEKKGCAIQGIDRDQQEVMNCIANGVPVIQMNLNKGLSYFQDKSFDFVILGLTFQQIRSPHKLLQEMCRVGHNSIVSVFNLGALRNRFQLFLGGKMPKNNRLPFEWYNTPNIHLGTLRDFESMCEKENFKIISKKYISGHSQFLVEFAPNFFADICIFTISN